MVEVRYEADVPITLSSVLSAATALFRRTHTQPASPASAGAAAAAVSPSPPPASPAGAVSPGGAPTSPSYAVAAAVAAAQAQQQAQDAGGGAAPRAAPPTSQVGGFPGRSTPGPAAAQHAPNPGQQQAQGQQAQHAQQDAAGLAAEDQADSSVHGSHVFDLGEGQGRVFPPSQHVGSGDVACMAGGGGAAPRAQHARVHSELAMLWLALPPALPPCLLLHSATKAQHPSKQAWQGGDSSHPPPRASAIINLARRRLPSATPPRPQA